MASFTRCIFQSLLKCKMAMNSKRVKKIVKNSKSESKQFVSHCNPFFRAITFHFSENQVLESFELPTSCVIG